MAIDFYPHNAVYLFVDFDPKNRKTYLIRRRLKVLERSAVHSSPFVIRMRKLLSGRELGAVLNDQDAKVLRLELAPSDQPDELLSLVIQLGGQTPNICIIDSRQNIVAAARDAKDGAVGQKYIVPVEADRADEKIRDLNRRSLSDVLDDESRSSNAENYFQSLAAAARKKINGEIAKQRKLIKNLEGDLAAHGNADDWKRYGDLILANISNIRRDGHSFIVTDFFDPEQPEIAIRIDRNDSPSEAATGFFKRYAKARNGAAAIAKRLETVGKDIEKLDIQKAKLEAAIAAADEDAVSEFLPVKQPEALAGKRKDRADGFKGARKFISSDGLEILVGKKAKDNDFLTFRIAKSLDLWLHAADYPGSHVVVRNPTRKEIPTRTLIEAAQLAAFYSDARDTPKAAVNYTQKKFINKPRRSAPGLVSLSGFKTILVEPSVPTASRS